MKRRQQHQAEPLICITEDAVRHAADSLFNEVQRQSNHLVGAGMSAFHRGICKSCIDSCASALFCLVTGQFQASRKTGGRR
jgi:hypothetical protein